ncbi:MULE transposase [Hirsutella rhossiliensis]
MNSTESNTNSSTEAITEMSFDTYDEALETLKATQELLGYVVVVANSKNTGKPRRKEANIRCEYSGQYRPWDEAEGIYKTSSKKSGCDFRCYIRFYRRCNAFKVTIKHGSHNHEPLFEPIANPIVRQRSQRKFGIERLHSLVEGLSKNVNNKSRDIVDAIRQEYPELLITDSDIHFIQLQLRAFRYGASTSTQAFLDVWRFFWTYDDCIADWKRNPELLIMDNTYKVNRFNMPLLQIIGTTGLHKSFSVGFGLTAKEDEGAFQWILSQLREAGRQADIPDPGVVITDFDTALKNALDSIFPSTQQQVCVWHMMKNVILHIKKKWEGSLDGTEIGGDRPEQETRLAAAAALDDPIQADNAIDEDRPIDRATDYQIQHASQLADQDQWDLLCIEFSDQPGNPSPNYPPTLTFY